MRPLSESDWLALWERGSHRHPIDRALLLCSVAREDLAPSELADLPLGVVNESLLRLRRELFGGTIGAHAPCPACGERLELSLEVSDLLAAGSDDRGTRPLEGAGVPVRAPTSRDLAAVLGEGDSERAEEEILRRCCGASRDDPLLAGNEAALEAALEQIDPLGSLEIAVSCGVCEQTSSLVLDIGALLWEELSAAMNTLIGDVHVLASAYGWTESEILALNRERRAAYLQRAVP